MVKYENDGRMDTRVVEAVRRDGLGKRLKDVFLACFDQIMARKIVSVGELLEYLEDLGWDPRLDRVIRRCYRLIRELHWGIFKDLDPEHHGQLWRAVTITNRAIPSVADLKRNVLVSDLYCAIMDIHAYTDFCHRNRHNSSMLRALDDLIQRDMKRIADKHGCISARSAGDVVIVIGSAPGDLIRACLGMIDLFSRKRLLQAASLTEDRKGTSVIMQDFSVSAGIAGGLKYSSLIITQDGDVSGSVVNTAARLQAFAGTISPNLSKIMVASHVYAGYMREPPAARQELQALRFFNCGRIQFKGVGVAVHELLYTEPEMKKARYQEAYDRLLALLAKRRWSDELVPSVTRLVLQVLQSAPIHRLEIEFDGSRQTFTNDAIVAFCKDTMTLYESHRDHRTVSARLRLIASILDASSGFDTLVRAHFYQIVTVYDQMTREFEALQNEKLLENQEGLFSRKERSVIDRAARLERVRKSLIERGRKHNNIYSPAILWNKVVSDFDGKWEFEIYSGKR